MAFDISISPDGQQIAVAGNGMYSISDRSASGIAVVNGRWDTGDTYPTSSDFSSSSTLFAATNGLDIRVFDASSHDLMVNEVVNVSDCGLSHEELTDIQFSADGGHVLARIVCGVDRELSALFFIPTPQL